MLCLMISLLVSLTSPPFSSATSGTGVSGVEDSLIRAEIRGVPISQEYKDPW